MVLPAFSSVRSSSARRTGMGWSNSPAPKRRAPAPGAAAVALLGELHILLTATDTALRAKTDEYRERYAEGETLDQLLPEAFATVREAARRTLDGIAAGRFEIHYPRRFTCWLKLLRILPYPAYFWAVRRFTGA